MRVFRTAAEGCCQVASWAYAAGQVALAERLVRDAMGLIRMGWSLATLPDLVSEPQGYA